MFRLNVSSGRNSPISFSISIHLMFRLNGNVYSRSRGGRYISIHLMFRLNPVSSPLISAFQNFNTSNVSVKCKGGIQEHLF